MVLTQTRWQRVRFLLMLNGVALVVVPLCTWWVLHTSHHSIAEPFSIRVLIRSLLASPLATVLYELAMNSGAAWLPAAELRWDDQAITFASFGSEEKVRWADYRGYQRGWTPFGTVRIRSAVGRRISFPYLAFAPDQRDVLFAELDRRALPDIQIAGGAAASGCQ
ncbi:MAG TPA: hypothetical protein VFK36_15530 [Gemmatimonadales bacterium]|nr:hypothetical protein [Gemmatimonadales bacterium]